MGSDTVIVRRWVGAVALLAALAMVICGETVLQERLNGLGFLLYWVICLGLTGCAVAVAFLDVHRLKQVTRTEQRKLFETTVKEIVADAETKPRRTGEAEHGKGAEKPEREHV